MSQTLCKWSRVPKTTQFYFLLARILDLTSAVQKSLGILLVEVQTFPIYRNDQNPGIKDLLCAGHLSLMNTEDIHEVQSGLLKPPMTRGYYCCDFIK